jgi:hypothetical protein
MINNELERIWKEAIEAQFRVLSWYFFAGTEENHKPQPGKQSPDRDLSPELPEYEAATW